MNKKRTQDSSRTVVKGFSPEGHLTVLCSKELWCVEWESHYCHIIFFVWFLLGPNCVSVCFFSQLWWRAYTCHTLRLPHSEREKEEKRQIHDSESQNISWHPIMLRSCFVQLVFKPHLYFHDRKSGSPAQSTLSLSLSHTFSLFLLLLHTFLLLVSLALTVTGWQVKGRQLRQHTPCKQNSGIHQRRCCFYHDAFTVHYNSSGK